MAVQSTSLLFWSVLFWVVFFSIALEYSNRWTVQIDGDSHEADRLARKHGFVNQGKVSKSKYLLRSLVQLEVYASASGDKRKRDRP